MDASFSPVVSAGATAPATGADLLGWSALPLLGREIEAGPWLFVTEKAAGCLSQGALAEARFTRVSVDCDNPWPYAPGALGGVVIDGDAVARRQSDGAIDRLLAEACRAAANQNVLIVCGDRMAPVRLRDWRHYGSHSAPAWRRAAARRGLDPATAAFVRLDGDRLTGLTPGTGVQATQPAGTRTRLLLRLSTGRATDDALGSMVQHASQASGIALRIDRVAIRKIGKTAAFLSGDDGRRYIMRIARSPIACARAARNFDALESLYGSTLPGALTDRVPRGLLRGAYAGYEYFVEQCLDGRAGPLPAGAGSRAAGWPAEAVEYIGALHRATAQPAVMDGSAMDRLVLGPIARLAKACRSPAAARVLQRVATECDAALRSRTVPLVRTHGDYTESNCLFDAHGRLLGVVDWEVSEPSGLPLLDLLQLMPVEGENGQTRRWLRFEAWVDLWQQPERLSDAPIFGRYIADLRLPPETLGGLVLMQWVIHVAERTGARAADERWMRLRVRQPIETLGRILRD